VSISPAHGHHCYRKLRAESDEAKIELALGRSPVKPVDPVGDGEIHASHTCAGAEKICAGVSFPASTTSETVPPESNCYGSVTSQPNPAWFIFEIAPDATETVELKLTAQEDVDHVLWGPFDSVEDAYDNCGKLKCAGESPGIVDDDFAGDAVTEADIVIPNAHAGNVYILLVTNYGGGEVDIGIDLHDDSEGAISCAGVAGVEEESCGTWTQTANAALKGHNDEYLEDVTIVECKNACCGNPKCKSFDYHKKTSKCDLSWTSAEEAGGLKTKYKGNPYDHYALSRSSTRYWTIIGNQAYLNHHSGNKPPECLPISAQYSESSNDWGNKLGVACCNDSGTGSRPDCLSAVTFDEANAKCQSKGLRLCTRNEIEEGKAEGTGCSFDAYLQWTSTPCDVAQNAELKSKIEKAAAAFQALGNTHNYAITMLAMIGALTMMYQGVKGVHKMVFATGEFQKINEDEMEC